MTDRSRSTDFDPFKRKHTPSRSDTAATKWIDMDARSPQVVPRKASLAQSEKAAVISSTPSRLDFDYRSDFADTASLYTLSKPTIDDVREIPDTNFYGPNGPYTCDTLPQVPQGRHNEFVLPTPLPVSPFPSFKGTPKLSVRSSSPPPLTEASVSPVSERPSTPDAPWNGFLDRRYQGHSSATPENVGWDAIRYSRDLDVRASGKMQGRDHRSPRNIADRRVSFSHFAPDARNTSTENLIPPPTHHHRKSASTSTLRSNASKTRKQSDMDTMNSFFSFGKKLKVVYSQGPQGEGQKLWKDLRGTRNEKQKLKREQEKIACSKLRDEQLHAAHTAALDLPAPKMPSEIPPPPPPPPRAARTPLDVGGPQPVHSAALKLIQLPILATTNLQSHPTNELQSPTVSSSVYSSSSYEFPIMLSHSVRFDTMNPIPENSQTCTNTIPKNDTTPLLPPKKTGLPPRPMPAPGESEPPEVAQQEAMYRLRVGTLPPPLKVLEQPVRHVSPSVNRVQREVPRRKPIATQPQPPRKPQHKDDKEGSFLNTVKHPKQYFTNLLKPTPPPNPLKAKISAPFPMGSNGHFAAPASGMGGSSAAIATTAAQQCVIEQAARRSFETGKQRFIHVSGGTGVVKARDSSGDICPWDLVDTVPPRPAPAPPVHAAAAHVSALGPGLESRRMESREGTARQKSHWQTVLTSSAAGVVKARPFARKRRDSDASMVCEESKRWESGDHDEEPLLPEPWGMQEKQLGQTMLCRGPMAQRPVWKEVKPDINHQLVPKPLDVNRRKMQERDTKFYRPVMDLLDEY